MHLFSFSIIVFSDLAILCAAIYCRLQFVYRVSSAALRRYYIVPISVLSVLECESRSPLPFFFQREILFRMREALKGFKSKVCRLY